MKGFFTFLAGALVGAAVTALVTPTTGEDLRARIKMLLQKHGILASDNIDELVNMIAAEVENKKEE